MKLDLLRIYSFNEFGAGILILLIKKKVIITIKIIKMIKIIDLNFVGFFFDKNIVYYTYN